MKRQLLIPSLLFAGAALSGCAGMSDTQQRTLSGAAIGAAGGAAIGALTGHAGTGAAIGVAAGALGGYLYDNHQKSQGY